MKNITLLLAYLLTVLLLNSCNTNSSTPQYSKEKLKKHKESSKEDCIYDRQISIGVATISKEIYKTVMKKWEPVFEGDTTSNLTINISKIESLLALCEDCDGVRIFFGYPDSTCRIPASPQLLFVNTEGCNVVTIHGKSILQTTYQDNEASFIEMEPAAELTKNWRNALHWNHHNINRGWVYDTVYAYTFKRKIFTELVNKKAEVLNINYMITTTHEKITEIDDPSGESSYGAFKLDLLVNNQKTDGTESFIDMAIPCPRECGNSNPLYPHEILNKK